MSAESPTILVLISTWGAVDWIAPVLSEYKERHNAKIVLCFKDTELLEKKNQYQDLFLILKTISHKIITPYQLIEKENLSRKEKIDLLLNRKQEAGGRWSLDLCKWLFKVLLRPESKIPLRFISSSLFSRAIKKIFNGKPLNFIFHDDTRSTFAMICGEFPDSPTVLIPHGTLWYVKEYSNRLDSFGKGNFNLPENSMLLLGTPSDIPHFKALGIRSKFLAYGHPKFDHKWISKIRADKKGYKKMHHLRKILFLSMPVKKIGSEKKYKALLKDIFTVASENHSELFIRLHPQQSIKQFRKYIRNFPHIPALTYSENSVLNEASGVDLVISFPSSAVMDANAVGTPVIEYFDYSGQPYTSFIQASGQVTSLYRSKKLVQAANNYAELSDLVYRLFEYENFRKSVIAEQANAIDEVLYAREHIIENICRSIDCQGTPAAQFQHDSLAIR